MKRRCGPILFAVVTLNGLLGVASPMASAATPVVTTYTAASIDDPTAITAGPDGALWFTNYENNSIGRITTAGVVTNYTASTIDEPTSITAGPDGALWFTNQGNSSIGRITTAGVVTQVANGIGTGIAGPDSIITGPDGALWFINAGDYTHTIGRITTAGAVTVFTGNDVAEADSITAGPDGALWFASFPQSVGRMTTAGVVTNYYTSSKISMPASITAGPDGALWFTNGGFSSSNPVGDSVGRITTAGVVTKYSPTNPDPAVITSGPDGALWFTTTYGGEDTICRITTTGVISNSEYTAHLPDGIDDITAGPDGALWFTNPGGTDTDTGSIGRIPAPDPVPTVTAVSPKTGPTTGGTTLTIRGTGFVDGAKVLIGQGSGTTGAIAATVTSITPTTITATTGGGAKAGTFSLFVTTPGGTSPANSGDDFTYSNAVVTAVSPSSGPTTGGTAITITGTGFVAGDTVVIGQGNGTTGAVAATVTSITPTTIAATTGGGAKAGTFSLFVIAPGGASLANSGVEFTYS